MKPEIFLEFNLIPAQFSRKKRKRLIRGEQLLIAVLSFILVAVLLTRIYNDKLNEINDVNARIQIINQQIESNKDVKKQMQALENKKKAIEKKINALKSINVERDKWIKLLELFERELPNDTWYNKLIQDKANLKMIKVSGMTYDFENIGQYIKNLESDTTVKSVVLNNVQQSKYKNEYVFSFDLFVELK